MDPGLQRKSESKLRDAAFIFAAAIAVTIPIYIWGIPFGNDLPQHYQFALQFESALREGTLYPSWAPDPNGGLGDVGVRFYPPLPYYALVFFKTLAGGWYAGSAITFAFWFCLGGLGVYFLSRGWFDSRSAVVGALVYTALPYHVNQIYNAFFYAEFAGAAILPFCFLFVSRVVKKRSYLNTCGLAAALAVLVLTHLPTAVMGLIILTVYSASELWGNWSPRSFLHLGGAALLGAAASSFYWIKLVTELGYLSHATSEFTETAFNFQSNFLLAYFYVGPDDYVSRSLWFADFILLLTVGLILCALLIRRLAAPTDNAKLLPVFAAAAASVFLSSPLSSPVWQNFVLLQKIQFPFRFLAVISLCAAVLAAAAVGSFFTVASSSKRPFALISLGILLAGIIFSYAQVIRPAMFIEEDRFDVLLAELPANKSCECWWPVWAKPSALSLSASQEREVHGSVAARLYGDAKTYTSADGGKSAGVFYYPHWRLSLNGARVDVGPDEHGMIRLPEIIATDTAELVFEEPGHIRAAQIVSVGAWGILLFFAIAQAAISSRRNSLQIK